MYGMKPRLSAGIVGTALMTIIDCAGRCP